MGYRSIVIDGPAGAGKSTIAKGIARALSFKYLDTGAMYRAMGIYVIENGIDKDDEKAVVAALEDAKIDISYEGEVMHIFLNGKDVTSEIRREEVGEMASAISVYKDVRAHLVKQQREIAKTSNIVMDGRDTGTVVMPDATLKIYLTASTAERARRRYQELVEKGQTADLEEIRKDIEERDYRDMHRENSPLCQAEDAVLVDSSNLTIEEVLGSISGIYNARIKRL